MFGWLKWSKPSHPMANVRAVRQMIGELSGHDAARVLDQVANWLDSINQSSEFKLRPRWEVIDLLDNATIVPRRKLAQDYISTPVLPKLKQEQIWNTSFFFWKMLGAAYQRCMEDFATGADAATKVLRKEMPLISGRALRASNMQLRWKFLDHGAIEERIWRELGSAYLFAEGQDVAAVRMALYPDQDGQSSAREELLRGLMLCVASPYNLAPVNVHIAERITAHFGSRFLLQGTSAPECGFSFDLVAGGPPARPQSGKDAGSTTRFFGAGGAERGLGDLMEEAKAKDGALSGVKLYGQFDKETVVSVLAHLARVWDSLPPARRTERNEFSSRVTVVPGFANILRCLDLMATGALLDPKNFAEQEKWTLFDKSDGGYGAFVPNQGGQFDFDPLTGIQTDRGDWLKIGSLVALCEENSPTWRVGVVRRITQEEIVQRRVGIELLEGLAVIIKLAPVSGPRSGEPERRRSAVLLSDTADAGGEVLVLMRAGYFMATQSLRMHIGDKRYVLTPVNLIEAGEDFDCARFSVAVA